MNLKSFILKKILKYNFRIIKINKCLPKLKLGKESYKKNVKKFKDSIRDIPNIDNFIFILRILDFRLWEFPKNWNYKKEKGFYALLERTKALFQKYNNLEKITFREFKETISPKEINSVAYLRYSLFKKGLVWLKENYKRDFGNYFKANKKPYYFCLNLFSLEKFNDFYDDIYFLKPNQLLYYEYILAKNLEEKFKKELEELTIFADYKIPQMFTYLDLIKIPENYLLRMKREIKKHSTLENELRMASILIGEILNKNLKMPSYLIDNIIWDLSHKIKVKLPYLKTKTIFY